MLDDLDRLIAFIQNEYISFNNAWFSLEPYHNFNLKNNLVKNLKGNKELFDYIFNYRKFLNDNNIQLSTEFNNFSSKDSTVNIRVKARNSLEFKIDNYIGKEINGEVAINKCLNDLFGIRIITNTPITIKEIQNLIIQKYSYLKVIDSSKPEGYKATHIYFKKDNYTFPWELQIWSKEDEVSNIICHEKYKQDYAKWEKENKGGNLL